MSRPSLQLCAADGAEDKQTVQEGGAHEELKDLSASSKMNAEWAYLLHLKERGRAWADRFLRRHFDGLGVRSSFDLKALFTDSFRPPEIDGPAPASRKGG